MKTPDIYCSCECQNLEITGVAGVAKRYYFCSKFDSLLSVKEEKIVKCHACWKLELPIKRFYDVNGMPRCHYSMFSGAHLHFTGNITYDEHPGKCQNNCPFRQGGGFDNKKGFFIECSCPAETSPA